MSAFLDIVGFYKEGKDFSYCSGALWSHNDDSRYDVFFLGASLYTAGSE